MLSYKQMLQELFDSVGQAIGIHVLLLVLEHARWKTKSNYVEADLIAFSETGITLDGFESLEEGLAKSVLQDFLMSVISTLGRLVGMQLAQQLTNQLQREDF